jgi:hypothetical protein
VITPDDVAASLGRNDGGFGREQTSYYDLPVLHKPHWEWEIEWYFFIGGVASGSAILSALCDVIGDPADATVVRIGRYAATIGAGISGVLLIKDLGRPERFLNIEIADVGRGVRALRVFDALGSRADATGEGRPAHPVRSDRLDPERPLESCVGGFGRAARIVYRRADRRDGDPGVVHR